MFLRNVEYISHENWFFETVFYFTAAMKTSSIHRICYCSLQLVMDYGSVSCTHVLVSLFALSLPGAYVSASPHIFARMRNFSKYTHNCSSLLLFYLETTILIRGFLIICAKWKDILFLFKLIAFECLTSVRISFFVCFLFPCTTYALRNSFPHTIHCLVFWTFFFFFDTNFMNAFFRLKVEIWPWNSL